jgi:drug/metabolite transporter (DMT)-like permease
MEQAMAQAAQGVNSNNLRSIYAMLCAVALFSVMDTCMKLLSGTYPAMQVAALRALSSLPLVCAYVLWRGAHRSMFQVRWGMHLMRAGLGIAMLSLFAYGIQTLSLAEAYAIFFIAPSLITALSVLFLKETVNAARWLAIGVGLIGVLVVLRPSGDGMLTLGGLAVLGAAAMYAVSAISARILARTDRSEHMVLWLMVFVSVGASSLAAPGWVGVRPADAWLLCALAISGFLGQLAITEAFGYGEASRVAPFEYTALAFGVGFDWLLWNALPDRYTLLGAAIIIGSGLYLIRHETSATPVLAEAEHP